MFESENYMVMSNNTSAAAPAVSDPQQKKGPTVVRLMGEELDTEAPALCPLPILLSLLFEIKKPTSLFYDMKHDNIEVRHDIEVEKHFAQVNAWKKAPFKV
jgi:hypothetical protein